MSFQYSFLLTKQTGILLFALAYAAQSKDIPQQGKAQVEMHSHAGTDLRCTEGDALADHDSDQPHSYHSHLAPERPFTQSFAPDLSFLSCCSSITFLLLLSPAPRLWLSCCGMCTLGRKSHSSPSGDVLYTAGQLSPPAAPAARAADPEKMHNMHIANSHSSLQSCAPDTQAQPSKLL